MSADRQRLETKLRSTFGLKRIPFSKDLEPDELFATDYFTQSLDRLRYLVDRRGIGAVFGAPGTGKSTLLRAFLGGLGKAAYSVCQHDPVVRRAVQEAVVGAEHRDQDRQREVGVVHAALLGALAMDRIEIGRASCRERV